MAWRVMRGHTEEANQPNRQMTGIDDLPEVLRLHGLWLQGSKEGTRADLRNADLCCASLSGANMCGANLRDANLRDANLRYTNLRYADLRCANLSDANLSDADLSDADLCCANLSGANMCGANLYYATGNMREIKSAHVEQFPVVWCCTPTMETLVQIGCQRRPLEWWETADQSRIESVARNGWEPWQRLGPIIISLIKASPATPYGAKQ
jgi:hypothetical protein